MENSRALRALAGLVHGIESMLDPPIAAELLAQPRSAEVLVLARAFQDPSEDAPRWATLAHTCAATAGGEHLSVPLRAVTTLVQRGKEPPPVPAYLRSHVLPDPGGSMEALLPVEFAAMPAPRLTERQAALAVDLAAVLRRLPVISLDAAIAQALAALRAHAWALPAHSDDCALYEHARLCAAAAACLPDNPGPAPLTLLVGELSGIQRFIFGATEAAGGAARRLRARSAALSLLSEVVGHRILAACELPLTNLLVCAAGRLYLLLPSGEETEERLRAVRREVDGWLRATYSGELGLHLAWQAVEPTDLLPAAQGRNGCGALLSGLEAHLARARTQPLAGALQQDGVWSEDTFLIDLDFRGVDACPACRRFPARHLVGVGDDRERLCKLCADDYEFGRTLPAAVALAFYDYDAGTPGDLTLLPPYSVRAIRLGEAIEGSPYLVAPLNRAAISIATNAPVLPRHTITRIPADQRGEPLDFDALSRLSQGASYLGYLRADVDRLGAVFAWGLRREGEGYDGLAQVLMLSRTLDEFMTGWVQHLLVTEFGTLYPVFGGGDDLVLIGPWDAVLAAAERIRADFARYVANPQVTLSAGAAVVARRLPVPRANDLADEAEKLAKNGDGRQQGRDGLGLFETQLRWEDLSHVRAAVERLTAPGAGVGGSFLHRLLYYGTLQRQHSRGEGEGNALRYKMWLAYDVGRNIRDSNASNGVKAWCNELVQATLTGEQRPDLSYLEVVARWAILASRKGEE